MIKNIRVNIIGTDARAYGGRSKHACDPFRSVFRFEPFAPSSLHPSGISIYIVVVSRDSQNHYDDSGLSMKNRVYVFPSIGIAPHWTSENLILYRVGKRSIIITFYHVTLRCRRTTRDMFNILLTNSTVFR